MENKENLPQVYQANKSLTVSSNKYALEIVEKVNAQQQALILFKKNIAENNSLICNYAGDLTPSVARNSQVQLSAVKKDVGEKELGIMIMKLLAEAGTLTGSEMNPVIQGTCAKAIMQEYWGLKYDEIIYVLRQGSMGAYGEISWKGLSFNTVMEWFRKYTAEREGAIYGEHDERKNSSGNSADRNGTGAQNFEQIINETELRSGKRKYMHDMDEEWYNKPKENDYGKEKS